MSLVGKVLMSTMTKMTSNNCRHSRPRSDCNLMDEYLQSDEDFLLQIQLYNTATYLLYVLCEGYVDNRSTVMLT